MRSSSRTLTELRRGRPLLGTIVEIAAPDIVGVRDALERAFAAVAKVHALMSAHDGTSDLGRLHTAPLNSAVRVHPWTWRVLSAARRLHEITGGTFDPIEAGRLALAQNRLPRWPGHKPSTNAKWRDVQLLPGSRVLLRKRARFDLGGIAKGFAVDRAVEALRRARLPWALVNAGGDLRAFGLRAWPIHVRHPGAPNLLVPVGALCDGAIATSAPYFSQQSRRGHPASALFDFASGTSVVGAVSVSVLARTCMVADALTKAVLLDGNARALLACRARAWICTAPAGLRHAA